MLDATGKYCGCEAKDVRRVLLLGLAKVVGRLANEDCGLIV